MGLDLALAIDTGEADLTLVSDIGYMPWGVLRLWGLALTTPVTALNGAAGRDLIEILRAAVAHMSDPCNRAAYCQADGQCDIDHTDRMELSLEAMKKFLAACIKHPKAIFQADYIRAAALQS